MSTPAKRKPGAETGNRPPKKTKGGSAGQWQTPARTFKMARLGGRGAVLEVGDQGIWVTFARGMERKAAGEFTRLCDELGEKMYSITPLHDGADATEDDDDLDIEASIKRELEGYKAPATGLEADKPKRAFTKVRVDIDCVFFVKTRSPVQPVEFCRRICEDARDCENLMERKTRYINRLTPITSMDKASENGIERAARQALAPWFKLKPMAASEASEVDVGCQGCAAGKQPITYAIRHSIRNNTEVKYGELIKLVASLIDEQHKVNLGKPDMVILVDVFQSFCGVGVIEGTDWDGLKKFNVNELYKSSPMPTSQEGGRITRSA